MLKIKLNLKFLERFKLQVARVKMASFAMFPIVFKTYEKRYIRFHSKDLLRRIGFRPQIFRIAACHRILRKGISK